MGGRALGRAEFVERLAAYAKSFDSPPIVVHGGGPAVDELQRRLGMEPFKVQGLRRSRKDELEAVLMALCGSVNKRLVAGLLHAGLPAVGLAGLDGGMLRVKKLAHAAADLGFVGEIVETNPAVLQTLMAGGMTPVVAPLSLGPGGEIYNVNADHAASALALALSCGAIDFISDVPGVVLDGVTLEYIEPARARSLIDEGRAGGGMIPKLLAAIEAVEAGVPLARIVDLAGLESGAGTVIGLPAAYLGETKGAGKE